VYVGRQVELSDEEIKKIIAILRYSKDACPNESLPENIDDVEVERLVSKFEKTLARLQRMLYIIRKKGDQNFVHSLQVVYIVPQSFKSIVLVKIYMILYVITASVARRPTSKK